MRRTQSADVIAVMENLCVRYGYPRQLVTDNGPQFTSAEFSDYCQRNGIKHLRTAPGHPQSNGQAERYVGSFKDAMTKMLAAGKTDLDEAIRQYLLRYRTTPQSTTGSPPDELFLNRRLRTALDRIHPDVNEKRVANQARYKEQFDQHTKAKEFSPGQKVIVRDYRHGPKTNWTAGKLISRKGQRQWIVTVDGDQWVRHEDQIKLRHWRSDNEEPNDVTALPEIPKQLAETTSSASMKTAEPEVPAAVTVKPEPEIPAVPEAITNPQPLPQATNAEQPALRQSTRVTKVPDRYGYEKGKM
ncbi:uncharacterized protein K02A2.6-like [Paramacrobiotus metropolitanus]|nr:uncharacterized protein K02A2.6-like [Paramacrobiotus metropolitanus]